jgi:hypothetical protein
MQYLQNHLVKRIKIHAVEKIRVYCVKDASPDKRGDQESHDPLHGAIAKL